MRCKPIVVVAALAAAWPGSTTLAQSGGAHLTAAQLRKTLIGRSWSASWGPFHSRIVFQPDGQFADGLNAPRHWHFSGNQICIASGAPGRDNCLDFYATQGLLTSYVRLATGPALSYHGPLP